MDFKQIEAFVNVAKFRSFSKAADAIYLSQPTISTHINTLETELNVSLFDRSAKEILLTSAGQLFYDYAINMLNTRDHAIHTIAEFYNKIEGDLHISSSTTPSKSILPTIIKKFLDDYPRVNFKISEIGSGEVVSSILNYHSEIGIVGKKNCDERLNYYELSNDNLVLISPVNDRFRSIKDETIEFKDIQSEFFIARETNSATRQIFESSLISAGYCIDKLKIFCEVSSMDTAIQFVKCGLGVTIISENAAKDFINSNLVKRFYIKDLNLSRKIYMVKHRKRTLSPVAKMFESFVLSYYNVPNI